jgi:hypothetical protein
MGYGGKTVNGLSSLGPKMGGKAHGGGVKIEKGMGKISQSQDDVLSGKETKMENDSMGSAKMISGGHSKGKFMSTPKYKGPKKAKPDYIDIDGDGNKTESMKEASDGMGKYGHKKGPHKESQDHKMAYDRSEISRLKKDIHFDDIKKKGKK